MARGILSPGENFVPLDTDEIVDLEFIARCAYGSCAGEIPENQTVLRTSDKRFYCSEACQMYDSVANCRVISTETVKVRYAGRKD